MYVSGKCHLNPGAKLLFFYDNLDVSRIFIATFVLSQEAILSDSQQNAAIIAVSYPGGGLYDLIMCHIGVLKR